jgi:hypothetical protein
MGEPGALFVSSEVIRATDESGRLQAATIKEAWRLSG